MARATDDVKNCMHMFRWIVREQVLDDIAESFSVRFPPGALDEIVKLEELCMLSAWLKGLYKQPEFLSAGYADAARALNAVAA